MKGLILLHSRFCTIRHDRPAGCAQTYNMQVLNASAGSVAVSADMYWQALGANAGSSSVALIMQARLLRGGVSGSWFLGDGVRNRMPARPGRLKLSNTGQVLHGTGTGRRAPGHAHNGISSCAIECQHSNTFVDAVSHEYAACALRDSLDSESQKSRLIWL